MTPKEFYESLQEKKPFTELTSTGISDNLPNVFEFAKMYAEAITVTRCCESDREQLKIDKYNEPLTGKKGTDISSSVGDSLDDF
jgi:hypothetical protein